MKIGRIEKIRPPGHRLRTCGGNRPGAFNMVLSLTASFRPAMTDLYLPQQTACFTNYKLMVKIKEGYRMSANEQAHFERDDARQEKPKVMWPTILSPRLNTRPGFMSLCTANFGATETAGRWGFTMQAPF